SRECHGDGGAGRRRGNRVTIRGIMVSRRFIAFAAVLTIALLVGATPAGAAITLTPVQVELMPAKQSELVAVTNDSDDPLRLQVEVFAWDQRTDGETDLQPTKDILAFP